MATGCSHILGSYDEGSSCLKKLLLFAWGLETATFALELLRHLPRCIKLSISCPVCRMTSHMAIRVLDRDQHMGGRVGVGVLLGFTKSPNLCLMCPASRIPACDSRIALAYYDAGS